MKKLLSAALIPMAMTVASFSVSAQAAPGGVHIRDISYGGPGCPQGTVGSLLAADRTSFTLTFDQYITEVGPGVPAAERRKFCQITLDVKVPNGWQFSLWDFDYRGYAYLERGIIGRQTSSYYWDRSHEGRFSTFLRGPYDDEYLISDTIGTSSEVYSPCGSNRLLNIKTQIALMGNRRNAGLMTADSVDGKVTQIYGMRWRRCR